MAADPEHLFKELRDYLEGTFTVKIEPLVDGPNIAGMNPAHVSVSWEAEKALGGWVNFSWSFPGPDVDSSAMRDIVHARTLLDGIDGSYVRIAAMLQVCHDGDDHSHTKDSVIRSFSPESVAALFLVAYQERQNNVDEGLKFTREEYWTPADPEECKKALNKRLDEAWDVLKSKFAPPYNKDG